GASGWSASVREYRLAIPGTTCRALPCRTNVFHSAISGRGTRVTSAVSSMSETMPSRASAETIRTRARRGGAALARICTSCQPGLAELRVQVASAGGHRPVLGLTDAHHHRQVGHRCSDVRAPAPPGHQVLLHRDATEGILHRLLPAEHHPAEHPHEVGVAVADVADRARPPATLAQERDEAAVEAVLEAGGRMRR